MLRNLLPTILFIQVHYIFNQLIITQQQIAKNQQNGQQAPENCIEMYPRLFFTPVPDKMLIKFNTLNPCNRSFVTITQNSSISKFYCTSQELRIQQENVYLRYIQNCIVSIKTSFDDFNYTLYGQGLSNQNFSEQSHKKYQNKAYRVNIPKANRSFNMIVTADWGPMLVRPYQPIYPSLTQEIQNNKNNIHALMIIGDIAYDLSTNECQQYELFMGELAAVSPYFPIIPIFGNHQSASKQNFEIFKATFQCYNLSQQARVQAYNFWNFKIVTFDPFLQIYEKSTDQQYQEIRQNLFQALKFKDGITQFVILASHYPVICSQQVFHCRRTLQVLPRLYEEISKLHQVDLYLGAHMHQYERIVSYYDGNFNILRKGPYEKGQMPSIVEGVAGNDIGIIDEEYPVENFSVSHTYNKTGYGILNVYNLERAPSAKYTHYATLSNAQTGIFDQVVVDTSKNPKYVNKLRLMEE